MTNWVMVAVGGALGAMARFWISGLAHRFFGKTFPVGTLAANSLGCLLIGFFAIIAEERLHLEAAGKMFLFVGFIGAFTTFSTFTYESWKLFDSGEIIKSLANVFFSLFLGFSFLLGGMFLGKTLSK